MKKPNPKQLEKLSSTKRLGVEFRLESAIGESEKYPIKMEWEDFFFVGSKPQ